jgi:cytochrome P450
VKYRISARGTFALSVTVSTLLVIGCTSSTKIQEEAAVNVPRETAAVKSAEAPVTTHFIEDIENNAVVNKLEAKYDKFDKIAAGLRMKKIFKFARATSIEFFHELRVKAPIYKSPGGGGVPNVYVVTKYSDVTEVLSDENSPIFTVKPYSQIMDATVGGPFMLARDGKEFPRGEKPKMRHVLPKTDMVRVREIIKALTLKAIKEGSDKGQLDVVASVSRDVPIGMNGEYFGFPGPSREKMAEWSRATQHAFFHNPFKDEKVNEASIQAGKEMTAYIKNSLIPGRKVELKNGRPAYDPVSRMIEAAEAHAAHGLQPDRIVHNTIGLLVGSVETTSAAIVQAYNYLLEHPQYLEGAIAAARAGNDALLDAYIWEALRFDPVNPWVARYVTEDYVLGRGKPWETKIEKGSLVLAATESAMHDPDVFPEPEKFSVYRDQTKYFHLGYSTHRCLGDDVASVMVPETIKHLILLPKLQKADPKKGKDFEREPFPEKYVVKYAQAKDNTSILAKWDRTARTFMDYAGLGNFIVEKIVNMEKRREVVTMIKHMVNGTPAERDKALNDFPELVKNGMKDVSKEDIAKACLVKNPKSVEIFPNAQDRDNYCHIRLDFRACYFSQVLIAKKSQQHAFNHCAYGRGYLTRGEIDDFKQKLGHLPQYSFLNY